MTDDVTDEGDAADVPAPEPTADPDPAKKELPSPVRGALLVTLAVDCGLAAAIAILNLGYGHGIAHLVGMVLWISVAAVNGVAVWNVVQRGESEDANVLLAQVMALVLAGYVFVAAYQSPERNPPAKWAALAVAVVAGLWIVILIVTQRETSARTFSRGWKVVSASFVLLSFFSLWLTTSYLPSTQRPLVDLATSLTTIDHNAKTTVMKATITLHNRGTVSAVIVGSAYRVVAIPDQRLPATGSVSSFQTTGIDHGSDDVTFQDDVLATAFDFTGPNVNAFSGKYDVIKADEIAPMREFLLPGQTWSTESVFEVPNDRASTLRLTAQIAFITDRYLGDTRACSGGSANQNDAGFEAHARRVRRTQVPADYPYGGIPGDNLDYMCVETALEPQSAVQHIVGNEPSIKTYIILSDGNIEDVTRVPYLVTAFETSGGTSGSDDNPQQSKKVDERNPSAVLESRSEYRLAGPDS
jgi:hypothetical protein